MHQPASHQFLLSICHELLILPAMHGAVTVDTFKQFHCHNTAAIHCYNFFLWEATYYYIPAGGGPGGGW